MKKTYEKCTDNRKNRCLMYLKTGFCNGLSETSFANGCPFFKDKLNMTDEEIEYYEKETYKECYAPGKKEDITRWTENGEKIREALGI